MISVGIEFNLPAGTSAELLAKPMARFLMEAMTMTHGHLATPGIVPIRRIGGGRLRSSLQPGSGTTGIDTATPPLWFKVGTNVEYAAPLDQPENRDPHYASGPSEGKPTKGWLSDQQDHVKGQIESLLPSLAADIQSAWGGG